MHLVRIAPLVVALASTLYSVAFARSLPVTRKYSPSLSIFEPHSQSPIKSPSPDSPLPGDYNGICLHANATTLITNLRFPGLPINFMSIDLVSLDSYLCQNRFSSFLKSDLQAAYVVKILGRGVYMTDSPYSRKCTYSAHSQSTCTSDNVCHFICDTLLLPASESSGSPIAELSGCLSVLPVTCNKTARRPAKQAQMSCAAAQSTCVAGEMVCRTHDGAEKSFTCVDTETRLDSCGGCTVPSSYDQQFGDCAAAIDCTAISHVDAVSCISGKCVVQSCLDGWTVDDAGTAYVEDRTAEQRAVPRRGLLAQYTRRGLMPELRRNGSDKRENTEAKPHADYLWRLPDIRSERKEDSDPAPVADSDDDHSKDDTVRQDSTQADRGDSGELREDWMRIPDIRRYVAA